MEHEEEAVQEEERVPSKEETREIEHELEKLSSIRSPLSLLIRAIRQYPPLRKREEFAALFSRYKAASSPLEQKRLRDEIIYRNLGLVIWIAKRYLGHGLPLEDLVQAGVLGLQEGAIPKFDLERDVAFSTYATWWIKHAVAREISDRRLDRPARVPVHAQERWNKLRKLIAAFAAKHDRDPTIAELSELSGIESEKLEEILVSDGSLNRRPMSLDAPAGGEDSKHTLAEILVIGDDSDDTSLPLDLEWMRAKQREALKIVEEMSDMRQDIMRKRFGLGVPVRTLQEIGTGYNLSRERIRQLESDMLNVLAKRLRVDKRVASALLEYVGAEDVIPHASRFIHPDTVLDETLDKAVEILREHLGARTEYKQVSVPAAVRTLGVRLEIDDAESEAILAQLAAAGRISPLQDDGSIRFNWLPPAQDNPPAEPDPEPEQPIELPKPALISEVRDLVPQLHSSEHELFFESELWVDQSELFRRMRTLNPKLRKHVFSRWLQTYGRSRLDVRDERNRLRTLFLLSEVRDTLARKIISHIRL